MVKGLEVFKDFFKEYTGNYLLIGGTACDKQLEKIGLDFRATKNIDIVLVVEAYSTEFVEKFWEFIKKGKYKNQEKSSGKKIYYRFKKPEDDSFPWQLELFSRNPDITLGDDARLTPLPVEEDVSGLSAILLDDEFYGFTLKNAEVIDDIPVASVASLICLKATAHLDLQRRKRKGEKVDTKDIKKHRNDIIRLAYALRNEEFEDLTDRIKAELKEIIAGFKGDPPDIDAISKDLGVDERELDDIINQLEKTYHL